MITIEKGIPLVEAMRTPIYPFDEMEIGDSFEYDSKKANNIRSCSRRYLQKKFTVRKVAVDKVRCWRIK
jgi:hypothetical protein